MGKLEPGESPYDCALRELHEETGLQAKELLFRGLISEVSPRAPDWQWLMFLYVATSFEGELQGDDREGTLRWSPIEAALALPMPEADQTFFPRVIDLRQPFVQAKYRYDSAINLVEFTDQSAPKMLIEGLQPRQARSG